MRLLELLTQANGVSGNEEAVCEIIKNEIKDYVDEIKIDVLGNLIAHKCGNGKKLMIAAHTDEIGIIVTYVEDNGFIRFAPVGGVGAYKAINTRVVFENGTVGVVSYEGKIDIKKELDFSKMYIDICAQNYDEAVGHVNVGDVAAFEGRFLSNSRSVTSKALDNRVGVYALIKAIKSCQHPDFDTYYVFTSQEEIGLRGAKTAAFDINPDYSLAVDITATGDTPNCDTSSVKLGGGACIKIMDKSIITHPKMRRALEKCSSENNIDVQNEVLTFGGTDAGSIHTTGDGVITGGVSIPIRYIHSTCETAYIKDIEDASALLSAFISKNYIEE